MAQAAEHLVWEQLRAGWHTTKCGTFTLRKEKSRWVLRDSYGDIVMVRRSLGDGKAEAKDVIENRPHKCPECREYAKRLLGHNDAQMCDECVEALEAEEAMHEDELAHSLQEEYDEEFEDETFEDEE